MTEPIRVFPDVQAVLIADLVKLVDGRDDHTGYVTPPDLADLLPFIRVRRIAGAHDGFDDRADVDVDIFSASYREAMDLARRVDGYLTQNTAPPIPMFDRIWNVDGPHELPWDDEGTIRRIGLQYSITTRRRVWL